MKKTPKAQILALPLSGADHRAMAILRHLAGNDSAGHWGYEQLAPYIAGARNIVRSKDAFTGVIDSLSVDNYVLKSERFTDRVNATDKDKALSRVIATIIEGNEGTTVTADAWDLLSFAYALISEASLFGAACAIELMEGRVR